MLNLKQWTAAASVTLLACSSAFAGPIVVGNQYEVTDTNGNVFTPSSVGSDANGLYTGVTFRLNTGNVGGQERTVGASAGLFSLNYRDYNTADPYANFYAFCLQPDVYLTPFLNPYTANNLNPVYDQARISELWGRFYGSVTNDTNAAAFQVALWELSYGDRDRNLATGSFQLTSGGSVFTTAQNWLNALNNQGPMANNLLVLVNNQVRGYTDRQDLLTTRVPEPGMLTLLALGLGLVAIGRRKPLKA
jgi:hypothetical protein